MYKFRNKRDETISLTEDEVNAMLKNIPSEGVVTLPTEEEMEDGYYLVEV